MTEYVLTHARQVRPDDNTLDKVLLILKDKPAWQKGRLNLLGGKIEPGETPAEAAFRELKEESGIHGWTLPRVHGKIIGVDCVVHCCTVDVSCSAARWRTSPILPREEETEKVEWYDWRAVRVDLRLMPNLRVIIPLLHMGVAGWTITDQKSSVGVPRHEIVVELDIENPFVNG